MDHDGRGGTDKYREEAKATERRTNMTKIREEVFTELERTAKLKGMREACLLAIGIDIGCTITAEAASAKEKNAPESKPDPETEKAG